MKRKLKFWPRTLVVQLIAVTAAAVVVSNLAVAWWFERGNEQQSETALNERVLDRAAAVATTLSAIPPASRAVVMKTMSSRIWQFTRVPAEATAPHAPMSDEESALRPAAAASLPPQARVRAGIGAAA